MAAGVGTVLTLFRCAPTWLQKVHSFLLRTLAVSVLVHSLCTRNPTLDLSRARAQVPCRGHGPRWSLGGPTTGTPFRAGFPGRDADLPPYLEVPHPAGSRRRLRPAFVAQLLRALDTAVDRRTYAWICPDLMALGPRSCNRSRAPEILERLDPSSLKLPSPSAGPHFVQPVIVHFFSGRRRSGDYQQALEELSLPLNSWQPIILSVDIVLSQRWGNLTDPVVRRFWLRQAYLGSLTAFLAGPPCESFSVARERWRSDGWGPRPLRSASEPWGYDSLLLREALQTYIGNSLLTFVLELFLYMWLNCRPGIIEHPAEPSTSKHPEAPSIWKLVFMHIVAQFPEVGFLTVNQGNFGAVSPKPTTLLHCHCGTLEARCLEHWTTAILPPPLAMGKHDGSYTTAQLKEYPPSFSRALAAATLDGLDTPSGSTQLQPHTPQQKHIFDLFHSVLGQGTMGPDFAN